jgi:hypothetical protein
MNEINADALQDWVPYRLIPQNENDLSCKWFYLGDERISEPFFNDSISRCKSLPQNSTLKSSISSLAVMKDWSTQINTIPPTAFIFHISRCGSTLLSQLLCEQKENIVLSEVPFFDEILRFGFQHNSTEQMLPYVKAAIDLYGRPRHEDSCNLFIKTDSWHVHFYDVIRQLYPQVPIILLYRKPYEVIVSQQKNRGMQAIPGLIAPEIFGFDSATIPLLNFDQYMANVIESYLSAFINILQKDKYVVAVNYHEGFTTIMQNICNFLQLPISQAWKLQMQQRTIYHAKYPDKKFEEQMDSTNTPSYLNACNKLYEQLEQLRLHKS